MSAGDAKKFYELVATDKEIQKEVKAHWNHIDKLAKKHSLSFTHSEYYDFIHAHTGMTKVATSDSDDHDDTDTCFTLIPSEPPRF